MWFWTQVLGSQLAAKTHQIQSQGSYFSKHFWGACHAPSVSHTSVSCPPKISTPQQKFLYETMNVVQYLYVTNIGF